MSWFGQSHGRIVREGANLAFFLAMAGVLIAFRKSLPISWLIALWAFWLAGLAIVYRRGWDYLFGPVLLYDLVRTGRRTRNILLRCAYALVLLLMLYTVYLEFSDNIQKIMQGRYMFFQNGQAEINQLVAKEMAKFAESFFIMFMEVQFIGVFLLTPAYAAGAIAEEKDRRTLEYLLATDLDNREIVLGKLVSRLAGLFLLVLAGLPILSLVQFFGGVDPNLILSGFAATGLTMLSLAGLSILNSVYTRKPRDAIVLTYLLVVAYLGVSALSRWLVVTPRMGPVPVIPQSSDDLLEWFASGNLFVVISKLRAAQAKGLLLENVLPGLIGNYALFHGSLALFTTISAVVRMRAVAIQQSHVRIRAKRRWHWPRPPVRSKPMLWKEITLESGLGFNRLGRIVLALIVLGSFVPAVWIGYHYLMLDSVSRPPWIRIEEAVNQWVRSVGTVVASLVLVGIGIRAASAVSGERDKQTLDNLLTSPLQTREILFAKWLGSILSVRWALLWLCVIWALGALTGGLDRTCLPWLIVAWCIYAAFMAALGLFFSTIHNTTQRASIWTLVVTGFIFGGHWAFSYFFCLLLPTTWIGGHGPLGDWPWQIQWFGMTPPVALSWLAFRAETFHIGYLQSLTTGKDNVMGAFVGITVGLVIWAGLALWLWQRTVRRFNILAGRRKFQIVDKRFAAHYPKFRPAVSAE
jgi:ABC-type transport system involved in multi-copper enzyme maturation permease subunit